MATKKNKTTEVSLDTAPEATATRGPRAKVLVLKTATEIGDRFGYDVPIAVGRKSWLALASKEKLGSIAVEEGL